MRILSALLIIYCCGCVVPKNHNEKPDHLETSKNSLSSEITIQVGRKENPFHNCQRRSRRHAEKLRTHRKSHFPKVSGSRNHRENVAGQSNRRHNSRISGSYPGHRISHAHRQIENAAHGKDNKKRDKSHKGQQNDETADWDDWTDWTKCSVTCGNGRQVRWRHCTSEKCPVLGLKRAQMKTCHFEDCPSKGVLSWLGIKSKEQLE